MNPRRTASPRRLALLLMATVTLAGMAVVVATPADAASGTLTVTTLDRSGHAVRTTASAVSLVTGRQYSVTTGAAHRLPRGAYDVYASVRTATVGTETVGVKRVRVSGTARVTIDARQGRPVRGYLRPAAPPDFTQTTVAWLCGAQGSPAAIAEADYGPAYVIPSSLPEVELAFASVWSKPNVDRHGATYYAGAAVHRKGVPAGMSRIFRQSDLTNFLVKGRTGLQSGDAQVDIRHSGADACQDIALQFFAPVTLPYRVTMHVPAGDWSVGQGAQDYVYGPAHRYAARHSYTAIIGAAAWGPGGELPLVDQYCRCLTVTNTHMFAGPGFPSGSGARVQYTLQKHGRTIGRRTVDPEQDWFAPKLPAKGWYLLTEVATRHSANPLPRNVLSPRSVLRLHFYADPSRTMQVGGFLTRFVPRALGTDNRARTKTTTVSLGLLRSRGPGKDQSAVKTVSAWMSRDGGRTWHAVRLRHVQGAWSMRITNPASGYVSLRAKVVDTHGNAATTEVLHAYAIG